MSNEQLTIIALRAIQNSKFKIQNLKLTNVDPKNAPYYTRLIPLGF